MQSQLVEQPVAQAGADQRAAAHDEDVAVAGGAARPFDSGGRPVGYESEVVGLGQAVRPRRPTGHHEERRTAILVCAVPALRAPCPVDGVEGPSTHHDGAGGGGVPLQDAAVNGVVALKGPGVQAVGVEAEAVLQVCAGPGDESVERHGDVANHDGHGVATWQQAGTHRPIGKFGPLRCVPNPAVEDVVKELVTVAPIETPYRSTRYPRTAPRSGEGVDSTRWDGSRDRWLPAMLS